MYVFCTFKSVLFTGFAVLIIMIFQKCVKLKPPKSLAYKNVGVADAPVALPFPTGLGPVSRKSRKANRKTPPRLFCEAGLIICCKGNKNLNNL